jgi:hypothetical protein
MRPCWVLALLFIDLGGHPVGVQRRYPLGDLERLRPRDDGSIAFRKANRIAGQVSCWKTAEPRLRALQSSAPLCCDGVGLPVSAGCLPGPVVLVDHAAEHSGASSGTTANTL